MTSFVTKINPSKLSIWIWIDLRKHSTDTCFLLLNNSKWMLQTCKSSTYTRTETKLIHQRHVQFHTKKKKSNPWLYQSSVVLVTYDMISMYTNMGFDELSQSVAKAYVVNIYILELPRPFSSELIFFLRGIPAFFFSNKRTFLQTNYRRCDGGITCNTITNISFSS